MFVANSGGTESRINWNLTVSNFPIIQGTTDGGFSGPCRTHDTEAMISSGKTGCSKTYAITFSGASYLGMAKLEKRWAFMMLDTDPLHTNCALFISTFQQIYKR